MRKVVIALGGNALGNTPKEQLKAIKEASDSIVDIMEMSDKVIIVHGNGPQVGIIKEAMDYAHEADIGVPEFPLAENVAMSQGYIGYHLQQVIGAELKKRRLEKEIVTVITQVVVDQSDRAFEYPTKPIGPFYTKEEAKAIKKDKKNFIFIEDAGRGYRRVVPSPKPKHIIEINAINNMIKNDIVVVAGGGGGIPVVENGGFYSGIDAVIDKDLVAAKLAQDIGADILLILTAVKNVCINYKKPNQIELDSMTIKEAKKYIKEGQFARGSMLPKIEACIEFLGKDLNKKAIITSLDNAKASLEGTTGTVITVE